MLKQGLIVKINSDTFTVKLDNQKIDCKSRGKLRNAKIKPLVGDQVKIDADKNIIEEVLERKNYLLRPCVANIDIALIVTSVVEPNLNLTLLDKLLSIVIINNIEPVIVWTKMDKASNLELNKINCLSKYYESISINVFDNNNIKKLKKYLKNKIITVCGQTGAGKSTLINKMDCNLNLATNEISKALGRGKHTTRLVELFEIDDFYIVDTPGFSSLDINNYSMEDIKNSFKEFNSQDCKFQNCIHDKEIGCKVIPKVQSGEILQSRYENYLRFIKESK